jgi:hypothetical protein
VSLVPDTSSNDRNTLAAARAVAAILCLLLAISVVLGVATGAINAGTFLHPPETQPGFITVP